VDSPSDGERGEIQDDQIFDSTSHSLFVLVFVISTSSFVKSLFIDYYVFIYRKQQDQFAGLKAEAAAQGWISAADLTLTLDRSPDNYHHKSAQLPEPEPTCQSRSRSKSLHLREAWHPVILCVSVLFVILSHQAS
jgi:hypothetical protein